MCGIAGIVGANWNQSLLEAMVHSQRHRGPDAEGLYIDPAGITGLGHCRLSIIDLSPAGRQPMIDGVRRRAVVFNGEIYNYLELRRELEADYQFRTRTDTEVLLAAFDKWGVTCLDRFIGMFAFALWDEQTRTLFAARDRFGVKPFYYCEPTATRPLLFASEIKALHVAGVPRRPDEATWARYLAAGFHESGNRTFWEDVRALPAGHWLTWHQGAVRVSRWYDLAARVGQDFDDRPLSTVEDEYFALLKESIRLRFRSDVPVGINLSGGLDSSMLFALVGTLGVPDSDVKAFTFVTGDSRYDELPWVERMLEHRAHPSIVCRLSPADVPALAESVQAFEDEPFGGVPTLAYSRVFERARAEGTIVLLDGMGLDEQWAGYDYYQQPMQDSATCPVQGGTTRPVRPECLTPAFRRLAEAPETEWPFPDRLRNLQWRDAVATKIPRALRFNDRISMRSSTELREPFLDHRLFELALSQRPERKIVNATQKWLIRRLASRLLPCGLGDAPKRPVQTPQREWLRGELRTWASECIDRALAHCDGAWLQPHAVRRAWTAFQNGEGDNSFFVWQWISLALMANGSRAR